MSKHNWKVFGREYPLYHQDNVYECIKCKKQHTHIHTEQMSHPYNHRDGCTVGNPEAFWNFSLDMECPHCHEYVDLTEADDFWDGLRLQICEERDDLYVCCPNCHVEFLVNTRY